MATKRGKSTTKREAGATKSAKRTSKRAKSTPKRPAAAKRSAAARKTGRSTPKRAASKPSSVDGAHGIAAFLASLPAERRAEVERVRAVINAKLPPGYVESVSGKYLAWVVPLEVYPDTYNGQALWYAAIASGKSGLSLHAMLAYLNDPLTRRIEQGFAAAGKKLDMGKACIRFRRAEDLALDVIGDVIASTPLDVYVARARAARSGRTG